MTKLPNHVEFSVYVTPDWPTFVSELRRMADAIEAQAEAARHEAGRDLDGRTWDEYPAAADKGAES